MNCFVFRNNTVERFFPKGYLFSGYDDISVIPSEADGYVWFYQAPLRPDISAAVEELDGYLPKLDFVLASIPSDKTMIALTMDLYWSTPLTDDDHRLQEAVAGYNAALQERRKDSPNLKVLDISEFTGNYPKEAILDWKYYFISQMGLNPKLSGDFLSWWQRKLDGIALKRKKCLVLDLDNTLWGGVLGEDGISGIKIGGDYPGKAFSFFLKSLLELSRAGVILAVCSKNNEEDVYEAWEKNPYLILRKEHFSTWRINWTDKATNLKSMAEELNIGLDSFVFVDDNPSERELVRQLLPMVAVPDFPSQPYGLPAFFNQILSDYFKVYSVTEEDRNKVAQYKANAARRQSRQAFSDFGAFLTSLELHLTVEPLNEFNITRVAQMTQKTNQFNLTTRRYTESDIRKMADEGMRIRCLSVSDRFGDDGITGVAILDGDRIDSFLLSCRILGKGIETAFLKSVLSELRESGCDTVRADYYPTAKNGQVAEFYDHNGFSCSAGYPDGRKSYVLDLRDADLNIEEYYDIKIIGYGR